MVGPDGVGTGADHRALPIQVGAAMHGPTPPGRESPVGRARWCSSVYPADGKELSPQLRMLVIRPSPERGTCHGDDLAHAAHLSTEVVGFEIDGDPVRLEHGF